VSGADLLALFGQFALLSLLSVGGMLAMTPEIHRFLVDRRGWLDHVTFVDSIAIAQAAPGPNVLFVTVLGWQAGGAGGALAATAGALLPSCTVALHAGRFLAAHGATRGARAFHAGLAPIAVGLMLATGWLLAREAGADARLSAVIGVTVLVLLGSRINPLWLLIAAATAGAAGAL
jgi:chromate transporter